MLHCDTIFLHEQAAQFAAVLQRALGDEFPLVVQVTEGAPWGPPGPAYGMGRGMMGERGKWGADAGGAGPFEPGSFGPGMRRFAGTRKRSSVASAICSTTR